MVDLHTTTKQFLRVDEVVDLLGVSRRSVYYWIEKGDLVAIRIADSYRVSVADLRRRLAENEPARPPSWTTHPHR